MMLSKYLRERRGRTRELADAMGVSGSLVTQWASGKPVAAERAAEIERLTGGRVRRWHLRPVDWHLVWPELVDVDGAPPLAETRQVA